MKKRVLILTYYWPPKGGVGVQRWLKLSKYLVEQGHTPIIYTADGGTSPLSDASLAAQVPAEVEVLRTEIWEPYALYQRLVGKKTVKADILVATKLNWKDRLSVWARANFFIPDARCFWVRPSVQYLDRYLKEQPVDAIISTGPPHSMHLMALALQKKHDFKWIADFRDPWTEVENFDALPLTTWSRRRHERLERKVLTRSDLALAVSPSWGKDLKRLGAKKVEVLYNGYDEADYARRAEKPGFFTLGYFGLYNKLRDYDALWDVLERLASEYPAFKQDLKLFFAGEVHGDFHARIEAIGLSDNLEYHPQLPHQMAIQKMSACNLLLVTQSDTKDVLGRLPAKLYEYLGARRPILGIGKRGSDLCRIIEEASCGWFVDFEDVDGLYHALKAAYEGAASFSYPDTTAFTREAQCRQLVQLLG